MKLQKDLRAFIELLNAEEVKYLIVGGYAVAFHGHPRYTGDIDFFVEPSSANAQRIERVMQGFGFGDTGLTQQDFDAPDVIVQLGMPPNRIDVVTTVDQVPFDEAWSARVEAELDGLPVHFVSKELLIRNKRAAGRAQDVADVEALTKNEG